jgi:hypothetical protein
MDKQKILDDLNELVMECFGGHTRKFNRFEIGAKKILNAHVQEEQGDYCTHCGYPLPKHKGWCKMKDPLPAPPKEGE